MTDSVILIHVLFSQFLHAVLAKMESLAAAGEVIAVVSLAGQVMEGCSYLLGVFDNAKSAPQEICMLATELVIIQNIIQTTPDVDEHKEELDFCQERTMKL